MYPNIYCKRKYYGNNNFNPYVMPMSTPLHHQHHLGAMSAQTQKLHPLAPAFEPMNNLQLPQHQEQTFNAETHDMNLIGMDEESTTEHLIEHTGTNACNNNNILLTETKNAIQDTNLPALTQPIVSDGIISQKQNLTPLVPVVGYHPLQNVWTLWYLETDRSKTWEEMQNEISSIDNVEDFWRLYNHIKPASEIKPGSDYSLFKRGIRPMWEDEANSDGGRWILALSRGTSKTDIDSLWLDVLLCLIGENFEHSYQICGAVLNVRSKSNKISVWTSDGQHEQGILEIGYKLREFLRFGPCQLHYQLHKDTMAKGGAGVRSVYVID